MLLLVMASFGFIVLYSAAGGSVEAWAGKHMIRFSVFLAMAIVLSRLKESFWKATALPIYLTVVVMLIGVELIGAVSGGSQRWLNLGFMRIQPSELMKPAIILAAARFYDLLPPSQIRTWGAIWPLLALIGVPAGLILLQPDLGTTITVVAGALTVAFLAGLPMRLFVGGAAALAVIAPLAFFFALEDYQQRRVTTFINPENDPLGAGYHITQSKIAIGSGGIFGKGFMHGTQSQFALFAGRPYLLRLCDNGGRMGPHGRRYDFILLLFAVPMGIECFPKSQNAIFSTCGSRPHHHDILLCCD